MSESFKVGEIAIVCGYIQWPEFLGTEVEIIGPLDTYPVRGRGSPQTYLRHGYHVIRSDGRSAVYSPWNLRKRRPPQDWVKLCNLRDVPREVANV